MATSTGPRYVVLLFRHQGAAMTPYPILAGLMLKD